MHRREYPDPVGDGRRGGCEGEGLKRPQAVVDRSWNSSPARRRQKEIEPAAIRQLGHLANLRPATGPALGNGRDRVAAFVTIGEHAELEAVVRAHRVCDFLHGENRLRLRVLIEVSRGAAPALIEQAHGRHRNRIGEHEVVGRGKRVSGDFDEPGQDDLRGPAEYADADRVDQGEARRAHRTRQKFRNQDQHQAAAEGMQPHDDACHQDERQCARLCGQIEEGRIGYENEQDPRPDQDRLAADMSESQPPSRVGTTTLTPAARGTTKRHWSAGAAS